MTDATELVKFLTALVSSRHQSGFPRHSSGVRSNERGVAAVKALTPIQCNGAAQLPTTRAAVDIIVPACTQVPVI